jgi:hypothetical protein
MHKYLIKICSFLILSTCYFGGIVAAAYVSSENLQSLSLNSSIQAHADEAFSFQEEGVSHTSYFSLTSPSNGVFSEPDNTRSSKDNPTHDFLYEAQHLAISYAHHYTPITPANASFLTRNRSIYLLDCAFLI